jgi:hypothetical protein
MQGPSVFNQVHSVLAGDYVQANFIGVESAQHDYTLPKKLLDHPTYRTQYQASQLEAAGGQKYSARRKPDGDGVLPDPQDNTASKALTREEYLRVCLHLMTLGNARAARTLALVAAMWACLGRSDDLRNIYIADMRAPMLLDSIGVLLHGFGAWGRIAASRHWLAVQLCVHASNEAAALHRQWPCQCLFTGPASCWLLSFVLRGSKTFKTGQIDYLGAIRSREPVACMQGAIGRHLCMHFTLGGKHFPDPRNNNEWQSAAMFPASDPTQVSLPYLKPCLEG